MNPKQEFIYVLKPREDLLLEENWTDKENEAVDQHFAYLEKLKELGILILAGKTKGMDEKTFGIVVLEAENEMEARKRRRGSWCLRRHHGRGAFSLPCGGHENVMNDIKGRR